MVASNTTFTGQGPVGEFAVGEFVQSTVAPTMTYPQFGEPVRFRISKRLAVALIASGTFQIVNVNFAEQPDESKWHQPYSEPVRFKRGLRAYLQQAFDTDADMVPGTGERLGSWVTALSEPVRLKPGLRASLQQTFAYHPRMLPTPDVTATWASVETGIDVALFAVNVYDSASSPTSLQGAKVSIIELTPTGQPVAIGGDPTSIREG